MAAAKQCDSCGTLYQDNHFTFANYLRKWSPFNPLVDDTMRPGIDILISHTLGIDRQDICSTCLKKGLLKICEGL